jgi:hypothetical protein
MSPAPAYVDHPRAIPGILARDFAWIASAAPSMWAVRFQRVPKRRTHATPLVIHPLPLFLLLACGPELGPDLPDIVSGHYRVEHWEVHDPCSMGVLTSDATAGISLDALDQLYAEPVPIRVAGARLEVPEPRLRARPVAPVSAELDDTAWKMVPLRWQASSYERQVSIDITFCESYRFSWSAVALDEETIHVTREGLGCGPGDGHSRICDNRLEIEYQLVQPCESPCELVDDREARSPDADLGDDVLGRPSRCAC